MKKLRWLLLGLLIILVFSIPVLIQNYYRETRVENKETTHISVSWWGNDERHTYTLQALDSFESDHPDVVIEGRYGEWQGFEQKMNMWMNSKTQSDVMLVNYAWLTKYGTRDNGFYDLNQLSDVIDLSNFSETDIENGTVDGKLLALPTAYNTPTMYYNESLYASYGLELPVTYDDLFEAARVMKKDGIYPLGMVRKQMCFLVIAYFEQTTGKDVTGSDGELVLTKEDISYILEFYERLINEKVVMPIDDFERSSFTSGEAAGTMAWISDAGNYCNDLSSGGAKVVVGNYPMVDNAKRTGWYYKPATMYAISSKTTEPKLAGEMLDYLLNDENVAVLQKLEKGVPVSTSAYQAVESAGELTGFEKDANDMMRQSMDDMQLMQPILEDSNVIDILKNGADKYIYGVDSLEAVSEEIYDSLNTLRKGE